MAASRSGSAATLVAGRGVDNRLHVRRLVSRGRANQASHVSRQSGLTGGSQYCARVQRDSGQTGTGMLRFAMPLDIDELKKASGNALQLVFTVATGADCRR